MANKSRLRFTAADDLDLLRAVIAENLFADPSRWNGIRECVVQNTDKSFTLRALKEHLDYLLKLFLQQDKANIKRSGTEEEYTEREQLLQEISDIRREFVKDLNRTNSQLPSTSKNMSKKCGLQLREEAASSYSEEVTFIYDDGQLIEESEYESINSPQLGEKILSRTSSLEPPMKRARRDGLKKDAVEYLINKNNKENELQQQQLFLEQRKMDLEERRLNFEFEKFELEKEERKKLLEVQTSERQAHIKILQQQQEVLLLMLKAQAEKNKTN